MLYQKRYFRGALTNGKLTGISVLNVDGIVPMKIDFSFIIYFRLGK